MSIENSEQALDKVVLASWERPRSAEEIDSFVQRHFGALALSDNWSEADEEDLAA